jgi:hypothetical protein
VWGALARSPDPLRAAGCWFATGPTHKCFELAALPMFVAAVVIFLMGLRYRKSNKLEKMKMETADA